MLLINSAQKAVFNNLS